MRNRKCYSVSLLLLPLILIVVSCGGGGSDGGGDDSANVNNTPQAIKTQGFQNLDEVFANPDVDDAVLATNFQREIGDTPPSIEGEYVAVEETLMSSSNNLVGAIFNEDISFNYQNGDLFVTSHGISKKVLIEGSGNFFTAAWENDINENGNLVGHQVVLLTGEFLPGAQPAEIGIMSKFLKVLTERTVGISTPQYEYGNADIYIQGSGGTP